MYAYARRRPQSPWPRRARNAGLALAASVVLSVGLARAVEGQAPAAYETVTVQAGDTLWSIASARYPGRDVRNEVWRIEQANHLRTPEVMPGQTLLVPSR
jgi:LysM repeat protein